MFLKSPIFNSTNNKKLKSSIFKLSGGRLHGHGALLQPRVRGGTYCFWEGPRVGLCCALDAFSQTSLWVEFSLRAEGRAGPSPGILVRTVGVAHQLAHGAQGELSPPLPLQRVLLVFDGVPGQKNKNKANKLEARCQAKIDETKRCHIVLPARALHSALLLPEHAGGVNNRSKINRSGDVC